MNKAEEIQADSIIKSFKKIYKKNFDKFKPEEWLEEDYNYINESITFIPEYVWKARVNDKIEEISISLIKKWIKLEDLSLRVQKDMSFYILIIQ